MTKVTAIELITPETRQPLLFTLAVYAGDAVLNAHPELKNSWEATEVVGNTQQFYFDLKNFLSLISTCLLVGRPNVIDRALREKQLMQAPLPFTAYVTAFEFIRDYKVDSIVSGEAGTEVKGYLNYLIQALSTDR
jgi:Phycobilisome protein